MTLSTAAKDYIASNFGRNNCYASSGISYIDPTGTRQTGSTMDVVSTLEEDKYGTGPARGPGGEQWEDIPDYRSITSQDVMGIGRSSWCVGDGGGGGGGSPPPTVCEPYTEHCYGGHIYECNPDGTRGPRTEYCSDGCELVNGIPRCKAPSGTGQICTPHSKRCNRGNIETCNSQGTAWNVSTYCSGDNAECRIVNNQPTCTTTPSGGGSGTDQSGSTNTGPFEVTITAGIDCAGQGTPDVSIDTSKGYAYFKSDPITRIGMSGILIQNDSGDCRIYLAWEMRMWDNPSGTKPTRCPTTNTEVTEINRYLSDIADTKTLAVTTLPGNTTIEGYAQFEIPTNTEGKKIVCFTLWGNYSKQALLDELLADEGYEEDPAW